MGEASPASIIPPGTSSSTVSEAVPELFDHDQLPVGGDRNNIHPVH
jgi:hypothetical protein